LRSRLLARVRAERDGRVVPLWRARAQPFSAGLAAAAACAAVGLGIWTASLPGSLDRERPAGRAEAPAPASRAGPGTRPEPPRGARGAVIVTREHRGALVVADLPRAPSGRTYEAWVVSGRAPRPAGTFSGGPGHSLLVLTRPVPANAQVAVSVEHGGGGERLR